MAVKQTSTRSRASKISNLCKSLIVSVTLMGAADSACANPNYWPTGNLMGPDVYGTWGNYPISNGVACYVPMTVPQYSYILSVGRPFMPGSTGTVSFAFYGSDSTSRTPTTLFASYPAVQIPSAGGIAAAQIAAPGYQNLTNPVIWVGFQFSNANGAYGAIALAGTAPPANPGSIFPGSGTTSGFAISSGEIYGPYLTTWMTPTFDSTAYCVEQTYGSWPSTPPSSGNFSLGSVGLGVGNAIVPYIVLGH